jgi:hypothetical protein
VTEPDTSARRSPLTADGAYVAGPPANAAAGAGIHASARDMSEPAETGTRPAKEDKELPCREPVGAAWRRPANCQEP